MIKKSLRLFRVLPLTGRERSVRLLCMGIALLFWTFVKMSKPYQYERIVQLSYQLPAGLQFREQPPDKLQVTFQGKGWDLLSGFVAQRHPKAQFQVPPLLRYEIGRDEIISHLQSQVSSSLEVAELSQNHILLLLDSTAFKRVPVVADTSLNFATDFSFRDGMLLQPDSATLYGSAVILEQINAVLTEPIVLQGLDQDVQRTAKLVNPRPGLLRLSDEQTLVSVLVEQYTEKKLKIPIFKPQSTDSMLLLPNSVEITFAVGLSRFNEVNESDFSIEADFDNVVNLKAQNTVPLKVTRQPLWVKSLSLSHDAVEYMIIE
jgi:hypothetical protein